MPNWRASLLQILLSVQKLVQPTCSYSLLCPSMFFYGSNFLICRFFKPYKAYKGCRTGLHPFYKFCSPCKDWFNPLFVFASMPFYVLLWFKFFVLPFFFKSYKAYKGCRTGLHPFYKFCAPSKNWFSPLVCIRFYALLCSFMVQIFCSAVFLNHIL